MEIGKSVDARLLVKPGGALMILMIVAWFLLACAASGGGVAGAQTKRSTAERNTALTPEARVRVRSATAAVGLILVRNRGDDDPEPRPRGSAVVVRKDGVVVTNYHVITRDQSGRVYDELYLRLPVDGLVARAGRRFRLKPVVINKDRDLALLRASAEGSEQFSWPIVELGDARKVELLDDLVIIGFPEKGGATITVNTGVVEGRDTVEDWIKTDARLIHGNSGGAAIDAEGRLVGIPTRVVVDNDGDRSYGAVGFLRPAHLVAAMLVELRESEQKAQAAVFNAGGASSNPGQASTPATLPVMLVVSGQVKSALDDQPIAGARVGLLPVGQEVTAENLMAWGSTDPEGRFKMSKPVPPGRYTLRAKVIGYEAYASEIEVGQQMAPPVIKLRPSSQ